jgi:signal transduction histidine kinase
LSRLDNPTTDRPRFVTYTTADGLSSNEVWSITEDRWGRIYLGTARGVDRLDPVTGRIKRYTTADGLVQGDLRVALRDRHGDLWFVTNHGISRLVPEPDRPQAPPPIWITSLRIRGVPYPLSQFGETEVVGLVLEPNQNQVQIDFTSLNFGLGESPRYQYRLEAIQQDWSDPTDIHTVNYASLSPGNYRFTVRALNQEGVASPRLAVVEFRVTPPVWQRWWFLTAAGLLVTLAVYRFYRYRVARLLELERLRTRIATDLHDDIGSSLSGMAFLSEAVKQQMGSARPEAVEMATEVAAIARGLARALSDVVWSIDPRRDDLHNLMTRVRQSAAVLEAQGIAWSLQGPPQPENVKLTPEQRHHLFLIFKEALSNIARHAHCTSARLTITVADRQLRARIVDDGCGFSQAGEQGNGLRNMKLRAAQLGGRMSVDSADGRGVRLDLTFPLK